MTVDTPPLSELSEARQARLRELPSMSATLVEFASPLVEVGDDVPTDDLRDLLESVAMLWNAFDPEPALGDGFSDVVRAEFRSRLDGRSANTLLVLEQRRRDLFGDDPRSVGLPAVTVTDGDVVTSVKVPVLDTPRLRAFLDGPEPPDKRAGLAPQYAEILRRHRLDHRFVLHGIPNPLPGADEFPQHRVHLGWRGEEVDWEVPALTELMRGDGVPPRDPRSRAFSDRYTNLLFCIEKSLLLAARALPQIPCDREIREVYRNIRRRPDSETGSRVGAVIWQALAFALANRPYSAREVDAVLLRLEHSVRFHERWPGGTEYVTFLRAMLLDGRSG